MCLISAVCVGAVWRLIGRRSLALWLFGCATEGAPRTDHSRLPSFIPPALHTQLYQGHLAQMGDPSLQPQSASICCVATAPPSAQSPALPLENRCSCSCSQHLFPWQPPQYPSAVRSSPHLLPEGRVVRQAGNTGPSQQTKK